MNNFRLEEPFETKLSRLKDLVNQYIMRDVWIRDRPLGPVTDSLKIAEHFKITHKHILRAIDKCKNELSIEPKFGLNENFVENKYLGGEKGKERKLRKVDITDARVQNASHFVDGACPCGIENEAGEPYLVPSRGRQKNAQV